MGIVINREVLRVSHPPLFQNTYLGSFSTDSSGPLMFHTNTDPSADPAANRWQVGLNATRDQSQPTLKLSLLQTINPALARSQYHPSPEPPYRNVRTILFWRRSSRLMVSSRTQHSRNLLSLDRSSEVILPCIGMSLPVQSAVRVSQKRIFLSKCPLMMDELSVVTRSLQLEPANLVSVPVLGNVNDLVLSADLVLI